MKKLLSITVLLFAFAFAATAQHNVTDANHQKKITKISEELYSVQIEDDLGFIVQKGMYWVDGEKLLPHGIWLLYEHQSSIVLTRIKYEKGVQIWVETNVNGERIRVDQNQITIRNLESRIIALEKQLAETKN